MKKGQIQGQVFIYILTLIITAGILLYGYKAITGLNDKTKQVQLVKFENNLRKDFEEISSTSHKVKLETYYVPSKVKEICFYQDVDNEVIYPGDSVNINNPLIRDSIMDNTSNNVFLVTDNTIQSMKFKGIKFSEGQILCINTSNNRLKLRLEGLGDGVLVGELL